jgi:adenosylhomocysteine nucleosidase
MKLIRDFLSNRRLAPASQSIPVVMILILIVSMTSGCQRKEAPPPKLAADSAKTKAPPPPEHPWVILYSYTPIGKELIAGTKTTRDTVWEGREITEGAEFEPFVLANSGVGLANATATTQYLIDRYHPRGIIFCGIANAINPEHRIGDICIPDHWITFDYGYWGDNGFLIDSVSVGRPTAAGFDRMLDIPVDSALYATLGEAATGAAFRLRSVARRLPEVHRGGIGISGNAFIDNKGKREQLAKQLKAQITDTESAAVLQTAAAAGVPAISLRACAAPAGESGGVAAQAALADFFTAAGYNIALVVEQFLGVNPTIKTGS